MTAGQYKISVHSETGRLRAVIIHTPGREVENMTPENAERALYSDILNLQVAREEFIQLKSVLQKTCRVFEVKELLTEILTDDSVRLGLLKNTCKETLDPAAECELMGLSNEELASQLIEGVPLKRDSLTRYLSPRRYAVSPLHNFFFTRDASIGIYDRVLVSGMASEVREREAQIMEAIFNNHPDLKSPVLHPDTSLISPGPLSMEGGDVLVAKDDILIIGISARTTPRGIDALMETFRREDRRQHILVQELPLQGESFIHLDMVFTILSDSECMIYAPVVLEPNRYRTIHMEIDGHKVHLTREENLLTALKKLGMDLKPLYCGGKGDPWNQEREQWHSGTNFFALSPGRVLGYGRNVHTMEELSREGYEILPAEKVIDGQLDPGNYTKCVIAMEGSELARGGGGARCMTMPVCRDRG